jgi:hypothetical protein
MNFTRMMNSELAATQVFAHITQLMGKKSNLYWVVSGLLFAGLLSMGIGIGLAQQQCEYGDFYVFYISGQRFWEGESLYARSVAGLSFLYSPFAALLHAPLSLLSLRNASAVFTALNVFALLVLYGFTYFWAQIRWKMLPLEWGIATLCTSYFFLINIPLTQNNIFLLLIWVLSIELFLQKRFAVAALLISIAVLVKVYFVFIVLWMVLRSGWLFRKWMILSLVFCFSLTLISRGGTLTWMDWNQYQHYVLTAASTGNVYIDFRNQSIWAFVFRFVDSISAYTRFDSQEVQYILRLSIYCSMVTVMSLGCWIIIKLRQQKAIVGLEEPALFLCLAHLFSFYTWNQHLVSILLSACVLAPLAYRNKNPYAVVLLVLYVSVWLSISSISASWQETLYSFGLLTIMLLGTVIFFLFQLFKRVNPSSLVLNENEP